MPATPFIPVPSVVSCRIRGEYFGDTVINDLYFKKTAGGVTPTDLTALTNIVQTWLEDEIAPYLSDSLTYNQVSMRDLTNELGWVYQSGMAITGAFSGAGMPGNVTASLTFVDGFPHRGGKPGNRVSGLIEPNVIGNNIATDWLETLRAGYQGLIGLAASSGDYFWCTVSRYIAGAPRAEGLAAPILAVSTFNRRVHTQRTRVNGR